jgi:hypothetical protein
VTGLTLVHEEGRSIRAVWRDCELFRYVYGPWDAQLESPRPYFHPVCTLAGDVVSLYRPHDHVWHKGIAWSLSNVGAENFWGGRTFVRGQGYQQLPNNGSMCHESFDLLTIRDGVLRFDQQLTWVTQEGRTVIEERRRVGVEVLPAADAWQLVFETTLRNVSGGTIPIGSPTTSGRENAGYSGLFWRGPRSFTGGTVITPDVEGGDELMGVRSPWLAFVGRHDGHGRASTLLFRDSPRNFAYPTPWFVRSEPFACLCPAPFFSREYPLANQEDLILRYDVFVVDGALDRPACGRLARQLSPIELNATAMPPTELGTGS